VLYVELDILPHAPQPRCHQLTQEYKEIPTVPTRIEALFDKLASIDFKQLTDQLSSVLARFDTSLGELKVADINRGITNLLVSVNDLLRSPHLTNSLASLHQTLDEYRRLSVEVRGRIGPLARGADATFKEAQSTLAELRQTLQGARDMLAPQAPLRRDLTVTLDQVAEAAHSIGALADFLNRNPNAILSGRKPTEHKP
jgi:paraquat-inducible protein B